MDEDKIKTLQTWKSESENTRSQYEDRWVANMRLSKGIFPDKEVQRSVVRNRSKIFFRKIYATSQRILSSLFTAFLRDPDTFQIEGRDTINDHDKAKVLQKMVEYRRDVLMRKNSLFLKFIWAFQNILNYGFTVAKFSWEYTGTKDGPVFKLYPNEQIYADFSAETKEDMRFIIFENFMPKSEMEDLEYDNIDKAQPMGAPSSQLRSTRHMNTRDALQNPGENEYPAPGRYPDEERDMPGTRYRVYECFYYETGQIMFCATDLDRVYFKQPEESVYGDRFPVIMGTCLTEAHKMIGEGFPELLEGPQESYNHNLNMRKDNVALALNKQTFVSRYGGVDLQSLVNSRPGGTTLMDDINAVKERDIGDVTQSSYAEAAADEGMMQELGGVTSQHLGMGRNEKATVAQINLSEGNAKIDLYIAIVGETFMKDFYSQLAYLIQRFETDETVFRIANEQLRKEGYAGEDIYDLDFEADCIMNVGLGTVGRQQEIQTAMTAMDRAIMSNQAAFGLMQSGQVPPEGLRIIDTTQFMESILPKMGFKNLNKFFVNVPPGQGGPQDPAMAGAGTPQIGGEFNDFQRGGLGG
jgi:hypothetical protein